MPPLSPVDDFEDVALSAVKSLCHRFRVGEFEFRGEKELTGLLRKFVIGKIKTRQNYHYAEMRNVNRTLNEGHGPSNAGESEIGSLVQIHARQDEQSVWLDEQSVNLASNEKKFLDEMLMGLEADVRGLFSELVKRLEERQRQVLMLITTRSMTNEELAKEMDCAPATIERYRKTIRKRLGEIVSSS